MVNAKNIVNISSEYLAFSRENTIKDMKKLAKEIGGMKKKENSKYNYYVSGQKIKIGVNKEADARENEDYIYIYNGGNKNVRLFGIKIGMSKEKAAKTLRNAGLHEAEKNTFWWGDAGYVKLKLKKIRSLNIVINAALQAKYIFSGVNEHFLVLMSIFIEK